MKNTIEKRMGEKKVARTFEYYNTHHIFDISYSPTLRPYLRGKHCWYEGDIRQGDKLYALVTLITGGVDKIQWLIPHRYLTNSTLDKSGLHE